jgi:hypothetical protein
VVRLPVVAEREWGFCVTGAKSSPLMIAIEDHCGISGAAKAALSRLCEDLATFTTHDSTANLERLIVVPEASVPHTRIGNDGTVQIMPSMSLPRAEVPLGKAIPVEAGGKLRCFIVLDCRIVSPMTAKSSHFKESVSILLEELLHTRLFNMAWRQRGHVNSADPDCTGQLLNYARHIHDEYVVARWKTHILSIAPLIELKSGGLGACPWAYGNDLTVLLDKAGQLVADTLTAAINHSLPAERAWHQLLHAIVNLALDPLARDAGYRAGNPPGSPEHINNPDGSAFYRRVMAPSHWPNVRASLERSFETNLVGMGEEVQTIADMTGQMLNELGVTFRPLGDGGWWIQFQ